MASEKAPIVFFFVEGQNTMPPSLLSVIETIGFSSITTKSIEDAIREIKNNKDNGVLVIGGSLNSSVKSFNHELVKQPQPFPTIFIEPRGFASIANKITSTHSNFADVLLYLFTYFANKPVVNNITPELTKGLGSHSLDFLKGVSHEVRSFLNGISGPMQLLKDKIEAKDQFDLYTMIDRSISRLLRFTLKTSLASIIEEHKYTMKYEEVELSSLIQHALLELNDLKFSDTIKASINKNSDSIIVEGDTDLIIQCFEAIIERIVLNYGNNTELNISLQTDDSGEVVCLFMFPFEGILDELQTIESQLDYDFKVDLGLVLARHILDLHEALLTHELLANDEVKIAIRFKKGCS